MTKLGRNRDRESTDGLVEVLDAFAVPALRFTAIRLGMFRENQPCPAPGAAQQLRYRPLGKNFSGGKKVMKRSGLVKPMVAAVGILALSGVAMAQREGDAKGWMGGTSHELIASAKCPQIQVTKEKITEDQARDFAQQYADKNLAGFKVVRPLGYGGGYQTVCYKADSPATGRHQSFYSVEYSIDTRNSAAETRNLRVDQFGYVTEFSGPFNVAGERGPAGPAGVTGAQGPAGPAGPQALVNPVGPQSQAGALKRAVPFKDIRLDTDKWTFGPMQ